MDETQAHLPRRGKAAVSARDERIVPRDAAGQTIREYDVITLSERDSRAFVEALLHLEPANETLHAAAKRYKARLGDN